VLSRTEQPFNCCIAWERVLVVLKEGFSNRRKEGKGESCAFSKEYLMIAHLTKCNAGVPK